MAKEGIAEDKIEKMKPDLEELVEDFNQVEDESLQKKISRLALELSLKANMLIFAARTVLFQYIFCFPDALQTQPDRPWTEQRQASIQSGWIFIKVSVL